MALAREPRSACAKQWRSASNQEAQRCRAKDKVCHFQAGDLTAMGCSCQVPIPILGPLTGTPSHPARPQPPPDRSSPPTLKQNGPRVVHFVCQCSHLELLCFVVGTTRICARCWSLISTVGGQGPKKLAIGLPVGPPPHKLGGQRDKKPTLLQYPHKTTRSLFNTVLCVCVKAA